MNANAFQHHAGMQHPGMAPSQYMGQGPPGLGQHLGQPPGQLMAPGIPPGATGPNVLQGASAGTMMSGMHPAMAGQGAGPNQSGQLALNHLTPNPQYLPQNPGMTHGYNAPQMMQQMLHQQRQMNPSQFVVRQTQGRLPHGGVNVPQPVQMSHLQAKMQQQHAMNAAAVQHNNPAQQNSMGQASQMRPQPSIQGADPQNQQPSQNQQPGIQEQQHAQQQAQQHAQQQAQQHAQQQTQQSQAQATPSQPVSAPAQPNQRRPPQQGAQPQQSLNQQSVQSSQSVQAKQQPQNQQQQQQNQNVTQNLDQEQQLRARQQAQQQAQQQAARQQQQANNSNALMQQFQMPNTNDAVNKLITFCDMLSSFRKADPGVNDYSMWKQFTRKWFSEDGSILFTTKNQSDSIIKQFQVPAPSIPMYYMNHFKGGIENIRMVLGGLSQSPVPVGTIVSCDRSTVIYECSNSTQIVGIGHIKAMINQQHKFELLDISFADHEQFVPRRLLDKLMSVESPKVSPKMTKTGNSKKNQKQQQEILKVNKADFPEGSTDLGITETMKTFLEVVETMSHMRELLTFTADHPEHQGPQKALVAIVDEYKTNAQQPQQQYQLLQQQQLQHQQMQHQLHQQQQQQQQQHQHHLNQQHQMQLQQQQHMGINPGQNPMMQHPGQRTPMMNGFSNHFHSPQMGHSNSPHGPGGLTPSPAHVHMQAPGLVAQHSQQGTNSSANASQNASPNVTNKRRRPSTVKMEGNEEGGGPNEVNGVGQSKIKASPRVGGKRQKGNPG